MSTQLPAFDSDRYAQPKEQYIVTRPDDNRQETDDEIDLRELLSVLIRRKGTVLLTAILVFLVALVITLKIQPSYKATATIQIDSEESAKVLNFDVGISGDSANNEFFQTQYELLKSRALATKVIEELGFEGAARSLTAPTSFATSILDTLKVLVRGEDAGKEYELGTRPIESEFLSHLSIAPVKKSQIVSISYQSEDPQYAMDAANAVARNFIDMTAERRDAAGSDARGFINRKLKRAELELARLERELTDYAKKESIIQTGDERSQSLISQKTAELNLALTQAEAARIAAEAKYRKAQSSLSTSTMLNNPTIQQYKSNIARLEGEYTRKLQTYKPSYPQMVNLKRRIRQERAKLDREKRGIVEASRRILQGQYLAAKEREDELRVELELQKKGLLQQKDKSIGYHSLLRDVGIKRKVYEDLLLRSIEINIASGVATSNIAVVDSALLPYAPQKPNIKLNLALGAVLGLFIGVLLAFLREFMDDRVKSGDELKKILGLAILGTTPATKGKDPVVHSLTTAENPTSALAESFRSLRTNLLFSSAEGLPRALAVTSAAPAEGKSSGCINLATAFAQVDNKVLLIDADMRKPTIHKRLKLDNTAGLSNFLTHQAEIGQVIQETMIEGVSAITAGPLSPNPSELLSSKRLEEIFQLAPEQFDLVIIDCPPVMGLADALVISNRADATVLVSAFGQTSKRAIADAYGRLKQARANVIGAVLTKVKSGGGYGYSHDYSTYYSYGLEKKRG
ncbi:MAG: hypothetical protein CSB47_09035 [Proteobacteria bacterium]|nr:MAG: hypothetical protein CSB47_09035 [Pseudomonadota bacterium]